MDAQQREFFNTALVKFGASVTDDGLFKKGDRIISSVQIKIIKGRIRFESRMTGELVMSGPLSSKTITSFVTKFWFWKVK